MGIQWTVMQKTQIANYAVIATMYKVRLGNEILLLQIKNSNRVDSTLQKKYLTKRKTRLKEKP